jgi:hypothetical protein
VNIEDVAAWLLAQPRLSFNRAAKRAVTPRGGGPLQSSHIQQMASRDRLRSEARRLTRGPRVEGTSIRKESQCLCRKQVKSGTLSHPLERRLSRGRCPKSRGLRRKLRRCPKIRTAIPRSHRRTNPATRSQAPRGTRRRPANLDGGLPRSPRRVSPPALGVVPRAFSTRACGSLSPRALENEAVPGVRGGLVRATLAAAIETGRGPCESCLPCS